MKKILYVLFFILLINTINAEDLSDYPDYFVDDDELDVVIVVGNKYLTKR